MKNNADFAKEIYDKIIENVSTVIVGQKDMLDAIIMTLFCNSHSIILGVPGLAKTLAVKIISEIMDIDFNRIQFTPDLMPSDITGTIVLKKTKEGTSFEFIKGPIFTNILLADEINRTPPKTQSALLQAMEERFLTFEGVNYQLSNPFNVFATQNPIEQEGTYPLPEAQLDRFLFQIDVSYPKEKDELEIISNRKINEKYSIKKNVVKKDDLLRIHDIINSMPSGSNIQEMIVKLIKNTRPGESLLKSVKDFIRWGASPRAGIYILTASKAKALIDGRLTPSREDVKHVSMLVLKHRLILSYKGEMENVKKEDIINEILDKSI